MNENVDDNIKAGSVLDLILRRKSVRQYSDKAVSDEAIRSIVHAGMSAPSCVNAKDWSFIIAKDKTLLNKMADANGHFAEPLRKCSFAVMILGDLNRAFAKAKDYWIIDCAIAGENMVLAAESMGIGSVWLGIYPEMDRVERQKELFSLPAHLMPHSIIAFGYPKDGVLLKTESQKFDETKVTIIG